MFDMHTAIQAKKHRAGIPSMVEKTINPNGLSVYLQREEVEWDLWFPSPQAWPTRTII